MSDRFLKYPTITEPTQDIKSIQQSIGQIKEIVEMLTGQRGPDEYSLQEGLAKIERAEGNARASIRDLNTIVVEANSAFAERITIVEAEITDARAGEPSLAARVTQVVNAITTGDAANASTIATVQAEVTNARGGEANLAARVTQLVNAQVTGDAAVAQTVTNLSASTTTSVNNLQGQINTANASIATNAASIVTEASARTSQDTAIASSVSTLSSTVGANQATLTTVQSTTNGIAARYGVELSLNGLTGGYTISGVRKLDGSGSLFTMEINANVSINGNLVVTGSIDTPQLAALAVQNSKMDTHSVTNARVTGPGSANSAWSDSISIRTPSGVNSGKLLVLVTMVPSTTAWSEDVSHPLDHNISIKLDAGTPVLFPIKATVAYTEGTGVAPDIVYTDKYVYPTTSISYAFTGLSNGSHTITIAAVASYYVIRLTLIEISK